MKLEILKKIRQVGLLRLVITTKLLKRIVKKLEGKSKITFITTPFNPNVLNLFGNEYDEMIEPLRNEFFSDDNFFDLSNSIKDNLYFYDNYHLNRKGVVELKKN